MRADPERFDEARRFGTTLHDFPVDNVQEPHSDIELGRRVSQYKTLRLHKPRVIASRRFAVPARVHTAKRPALLVLHGRSPIWKQQVTFV